MRIPIITVCLLISGCATSHRSSKCSQDGELDTAARLAAIEIRLEAIDEKLAMIQAYETGIYVVRPGDTATAIAKLFDIRLADLEKLNHTVQWNHLRVGQRITVREILPNKIAAHEPSPGVSVRGYVPVR